MTYLILRISSLGNVAMTVPLITSISRRYPDDRFVVVAKKRLSAMFYGLPNVIFHEEEFEDGWQSIHDLYKQLETYAIDAVVDLQDIWLTRIIRMRFRIGGSRVTVIRHRRRQTREFDRYADALQRAGLRVDDDFTAIPVNADALREVDKRFGKRQGHWIGLAPFAKSKSNMLPHRTTKELIQRLTEDPEARIFLFGAGKIECEMLQLWADTYPRVESVAGELPLEQELELMRQLDVMICMDSANQHLSSLVALRAVSIWCGTDPKSGFYGWKQDPADSVAIDDLRCRPCSLHGTNQCLYRNFACRDVTVQQIIQTTFKQQTTNI